MECVRCGAEQLPNTLFCDSCGEEILSQDGNSHAQSVHTMVRVELLDGRRSITLPDLPELILGREGNAESLSDVPLDRYGGRERGVSRQHARLSRRGMHLYLEDLGSLNGTYVNERRLPPGQPMRIYAGDIIRLGLLRLSFSISTYHG